MTDSNLLDSSIWLEYFHNDAFNEIIESNTLLLLSTLSLFEIKKKLLQSKVALPNVYKALSFVKRKSLVIQCSEDIVEHAAELSIKHKLPMADAIIYATALHEKATVLTLDNDFRNLKHATVLSFK